MYSNFQCLVCLIKGKLIFVVLEIFSQWVLSSPKHFPYFNRLRFSFCPSENSHIWAIIQLYKDRMAFLPFLFLFVISLPCHFQRATIVMSHRCFFFEPRVQWQQLHHLMLVDIKSNPIRNSLWYIIGLDRKGHCQYCDDNYNLTKMDKSVLHLGIRGVS